ncbi:MAG: LacI family DNA-binding transcriptional regulator [Chloroflexota bacterium]
MDAAANSEKITIVEVARQAGVSLGTASRALSGNTHVHALLRERVQNVARELGYSPDPFAQALRRGHSRTIAFCVAFITNPTMAAIIQGASLAAHEAGYNLSVCATGRNRAVEQAQLEALARQRVAGVISFNPSDDPAPYLRLQQTGTRLLFVDHRPQGIEADMTMQSHRECLCQVVAHLLSRGRRRVALLFTAPGTAANLARLAGYHDAYAAASLAMPPGLTRGGLYREADGYGAVVELLALSERPDALVVAAGVLIEGALAALRDHGVSIPQDMAFVGAGDLGWARLVEPPLSMIEVDGFERGRELIGLLLSRLEGDGASPFRDVAAPFRFVPRASS